MRLLALVLAVSCAGSLPAQDRTGSGRQDPGAAPAPILLEPPLAASRGEAKPERSHADRAAFTGGMAASAAPPGACRAVAQVIPSRLAGGRDGLLTIVIEPLGNAVVEANARIAVTYAREQGALVLEPWRLLPAGTGILDTVFKGHPVFDRVATVEIPVRVLPAARDGEQQLRLQVRVPLTDGQSGAAIGIWSSEVAPRATLDATAPAPPRARTATTPQAAQTSTALSEAHPPENARPEQGDPHDQPDRPQASPMDALLWISAATLGLLVLLLTVRRALRS